MPLGVHQKVGISWLIIIGTSLSAFFIARNWAVGNRRDSMKARQRVQKELERTSQDIAEKQRLARLRNNIPTKRSGD